MPPSNSSPQDPYGFIMNNPNKPARRPILPSSKTSRIIIAIIGAIVAIILAVIVSTLLSGGSKAQTARYTEIAQKQAELIRLTTLTEKRAKKLSTRSYVVTAKVSLESSQKNMAGILSKRGIKEKQLNKLLPAGKNSKSDARLDEAEKSSRFDEVFMQLMAEELSSYQKLLKQASSEASKNEKKVLNAAANQVTTLQLKPGKSPRKPINTSPDEEILSDEAGI